MEQKIEISKYFDPAMSPHFKTIIELDEISNSISKDISRDVSSGMKLYSFQLSLLEIFKHETVKLDKLGYCDFELAYLLYRLTNLLYQSAEEHTTKSQKDFRKSIGQQIQNDYVKFDTVKKELVQRSDGSPTADSLLLRFNALKTNGNVVSDVDMLDTLKYRESITPRELLSLISESKYKILLIDFRASKDFDHNHINYENVLNIEPSHIELILQKKGLEATDQDLEDRLQIHLPSNQFTMFKERYTYDLVVLYNLSYGKKEQNEERLLSLKDMLLRGAGPCPFARLIDLITFRNKYLTSKLKQYPCYLAGGVQEWYKLFGTSALQRTNTNTILSKPSASVSRNNSYMASSPNTQSAYLKNFSEYLSVAKSTASTPSSNYFVPSTTIVENYPNRKYTQSEHHTQQAPQRKSSLSGSIKNLKARPSSTSQLTNESANKEILSSSATKTQNSIQFCTTGLVNLGNSCYMNCVLQCLSATPQLTEFFFPNNNSTVSSNYRQHINVNNTLGSKGIVTNCFVQLLQNLFKNTGGSFSPSTFKKIIGSLSPGGQFASFDQQDCVEFLEFLLDSLHEDLNQMVVMDSKERKAIVELTQEQEQAREVLPVRLASTVEWERYLKLNFSVVVDYFQGQYLSHLKCLECGNTSSTYNAFSILSLPIPERLTNTGESVLLDYCLKEFTTTELLDENNKWHCPSCKRFTKLTKTISITRLPQVLIINFKRFSMTNNGYFHKLDTFVKYPVRETLDLSNYWPKIGTYINKGTGKEISTEQELKYLSSLATRNQVPPFRYKLYGVVNHFGNLTTGHYTSYVYKPSDDKKARGWCYFDDSKVTYNCSTSQVLNKNAYCLFYQRI